MSIKTKLTVTIVITIVLALIVGLGEAITKPNIIEPKTTESTLNDPTELTVVQDFTYIRLNDTQTIEHADAIFLGKVINISPTQWNQDSGEPWDDGLLIHEIEIEVLRPIVDTVGLGAQTTITMLGNSPLDGHSEYSLNIGDQAVIFVGETDQAWREGGSRRVLKFVGDPADAYYLQRSDGLYQGRPGKAPLSFDEVVDQIRQKRPTLVRP